MPTYSFTHPPFALLRAKWGLQRTEICNLRLTNVTSHPEYIPSHLGLLQSMGNEARFAVLSLPNGTVYSNTAKTIEKLDLCDIER